MKLLAAIFAALIVLAAPMPALAQERVTAPVGGISLEKPAGWVLIPPDESLSNIKEFDFDDPRTTANLQAPLITFMRNRPEEVVGITPAIKVNFTPYPGSGERSAVAITNDIIAAMPQALPDIKVLVPARAVTIGGRPGAGVRVGFTLKLGPDMVSIETELYVIPRGKAGIFVIGFSYLAGDEAKLRPIFDAALASVRFDAK